MYEIEIADQQECLAVDSDWLKKIAAGTLAAEQVAAAELSIALVGNAEIWDINRQFLGHDYATDVISFLLECEPANAESAAGAAPDLRRAGLRGAGKTIGGEIIISTEMASQMAGEYQWNPLDELALYLVHGILHLCGYDDLSESEQHMMRGREKDVLSAWNLTPHYATETC